MARQYCRPRVVIASSLFVAVLMFFHYSPFPWKLVLIDEKLHSFIQQDYPGINERSSVEDEDTAIERTKGEGGPSIQMELARKQVTQTSKEMLLFLHDQFNSLKASFEEKNASSDTVKEYDDTLKNTLSYMAEYHSAINDQLDILTRNDGWSTWRRKEAGLLLETVKSRLHALQNPSNCSEAPFLLCDLKSTSGFGSGLHDILHCFIKAYYLNHRMVLDTKSWHYAPQGWETLFEPLSDTCRSHNGTPASTGPGGNNDKDRNLLRVLPRDLGPRIIRLHSSPLAWWYGQFFGYLMRPNARLKKFLDNFGNNIPLNKTIVGVHVRRTDKAKEEAKAHELEDYMRHVEDFFIGLEMKTPNIKRQVYIATDDTSVIEECSSKYKNYICFSNYEGSRVASDMKTRYSNTSLWGVLADVFVLANTDFLVCTFSSNLCRLAYELRHAFQLEGASDRVVSIDVEYYYANVSPPSRRALYSHRAKSEKEIGFDKGDVFRKKNEWSVLYEAVGGKKQNGLGNFVAIKNQKEGLIPHFKVQEQYKLIDLQGDL